VVLRVAYSFKILSDLVSIFVKASLQPDREKFCKDEEENHPFINKRLQDEIKLQCEMAPQTSSIFKDRLS
jgi:hypothetical protein